VQEVAQLGTLGELGERLGHGGAVGKLDFDRIAAGPLAQHRE
jgi:hypothetical protein